MQSSSSYSRLPQDWSQGGIQRISWLANQSRYLIKRLKRGRVHNLDSLKNNSRTRILLKKAQTHKKSDFGRHIILRFYKKHNLASELFLFNKEILVEIFFECVFGRLKCDCRCSHFWHDCCFLESSVSLILKTMNSLEEQPSYKEPSWPVGRMQLG